VSLSLDTAVGVEADTTVITLTATADSAVSIAETIDVVVAGTNITQGDYVLSGTSITIPAGQTSGSVTFTVQNDALVELTETATVTLTNPSIGISRGTTISQDISITNSTMAELSIDDVSALETDAGTTILEFTVTLNNAVDAAFSLAYATADGTATAGNDYTTAAAALNFAGTAGETQKFQVTVTGDSIVELHETVLVDLSGISAGSRAVTFADNQGVGTITNDDQASLSIDDVSAEETDAGTVFTFTVTVDKAVDTAFSVDYSTVDGTATVADTDFVAISGSTLNFTGGVAGETQTLQVTIVGDTVAEIDETFTVSLLNVVATGRDVVLGDSSGGGTIIDDDGVALNLGVSVSSGSEAAGTTITLVATAAVAVTGDQTVNVIVSGTGITNTDYQLAATTITIADGQTIGTVTFTVLNDNVAEALETATVMIANPSAGVKLGVTTSQDITITSDDVASVSIDDVSITEGDSGTQLLTFTATADIAVQGGFTVDYATVDDIAEAGVDYVAASGTLTFAGTAAEAQQFTVTISGDTTVELDEGFFVNLSNPSNGAGLSDGQAVGTITNDDIQTQVNVSLLPSVGKEADQTSIVITATASAAVVGDQTVDVAVSGTAIAAGYYSLAATQITIQDGQATGTVTLLIAADGNLEAAIETATVTISNPSSGVVLGSTVSANFTIQDDTSITLDEVSRYPGSQPTVTWQPVPGAVRYEMWFSRVFPSGQRIYSDTNVSGTSWTPPAVLDAAAYRYWVRAFDFNGNATPWSLPNTFEVRPTLIGPLNGAFTQRPTFEWEPIPLATGYTLFLRSDSGDQVITDITGTSYIPTSNLPAGTVRWWIRPADAIGNRGWTTAGVVGSQPRTVLQTPAGTQTDVTPTFTWSPVSGAGRYIVHVVNTDTNQVVIREDDVNANSYTSSALPAGNYRYWVKAIDAATNEFTGGLWSNPLNFTIVVAATTMDTEAEATNSLTAFVEVSDLLEPASQVEVIAAVEAEAAPTARTVASTPQGETFDTAVEIELAMLDTVMGAAGGTGWLFE
jgi:hypothetical protein